MPALARLAVIAMVAPLSACLAFDLPDTAERTMSRTFAVRPQSHLRVNIRGGSISTQTGDAGSIRVDLIERVRAKSEQQMDTVLQNYEVSAKQDGDFVTILARRRTDAEWRIWNNNDNVNFSARIIVPSDVALTLGTSGGSISVRGDRPADLKANTSGGSIKVDGGEGVMDLDTSGGSISVERALRSVEADTSGGGITVRYVGPGASNVNLDTSGGSIHVGVDPDASLRVEAQTSGGSVHVNGLPFTVSDNGRSHARGILNDGKGRLHASTSGGSITIGATR
ncbi:MAG: DUF4097 family beta strand repeat-containing protein [Acidobacteriota bacterium]